MTFTFDETLFSDLHKDAYGFRPNGLAREEWAAATDSRKQEIWDELLEALDRAQRQEEARQEASVADFRAQVERNLQLGARDEYQARKWIVQALDLDANEYIYGGEIVCFRLDLPYTMSKMFDQICRELRQAAVNEYA